MSVACHPLIEVLSEMPDFRHVQGKRHPLSEILALQQALRSSQKLVLSTAKDLLAYISPILGRARR